MCYCSLLGAVRTAQFWIIWIGLVKLSAGRMDWKIKAYFCRSVKPPEVFILWCLQWIFLFLNQTKTSLVSEHCQHPFWHIHSNNFEKCNYLNEDLGISWGGEELEWEELSWQPGSKKRRNEAPSPTWCQRDCAWEPKLRRGHLLCLWGTPSLLFEVWTPTSDTNSFFFKDSWFGGGRWLLGSGWNNFSCGRQPQMYFRLRSPEGPLFQLTACSLRLVLKCLYILIQLLSDHIYCKCCPAIICKRSIIYFYAPNRKYKSKVQSSTNNLFYRTAFLRAGPLLCKWLFFQSVF